ncbi:MAG: tyrosine-type recombinase/integrase [Acidimicrobiia bacterium]|nr:tyrosine-type recombinase/integrase [Acidimicrobiia bacterium]
MNGRVVALADYRGTPRLRSAVEAYFSDKQLSPNTRRAYSQALSAITEELGWDLPLDQLDSRRLLDVFQKCWGAGKPATWNTRFTAVRSFVSYCQRNAWLQNDPMVLIDRRRIPRDQTKAIPYQDLEALWSRRGIHLREKTLWRMLYETAARAGEILALNVENLDLPRKRAVIIGKGGHKECVFWASGTARLLSRCLAGRRRGPVFLTHRRPNVIPARGDECPHTGRGRLSYERASMLFKEASGGWTLHQLRHSSLTHLGEQGASTILLQAKSRHQDPRTLAIYTKPGTEAIAQLTSAFDKQVLRKSRGSRESIECEGGSSIIGC